MAYISSLEHLRRTLVVNLSKMAGPVTACWFNPAQGGCTTVEGSPLQNTGHYAFVTPGDNGTGTSDWVLILEADDKR